MKTMLLMRHAKSSHEEPVSDHDRTLNARGRDDAPEMGRLLDRHDLVPDIIVCSTAQRARETAELVAAACGYSDPIQERRELYLAPPEAYMKVARALSDELEMVLLIGHNPGLEELVSELRGEMSPFPTCALAHFDWKVEAWDEVRFGEKVKFRDLWVPK